MDVQRAEEWFESNGWTAFPFQKEAWKRFSQGENGIVNAPTGSGKTYSLMMPILLGLEGGGGEKEKTDPPPGPLPGGGTTAGKRATNTRKPIAQTPPPGRGQGGGQSGSNWKSKIIPYSPNLKERARQMRNNPTQGEAKVWTYLKGNNSIGFDFDRQRAIDHFIVDFYCRDLQLVVEVDGATHLDPAQIAYDQQRDRKLFELGLNVLRFDGNLVHNRIDEVIGWIQTYAECYKAKKWDAFDKGGWEHLNKYLDDQPESSDPEPENKKRTKAKAEPKSKIPSGLQAIWITPIRALGKEILQSATRATEGLGIEAKIAIRSGDTDTKEKTRLKKSPPHILITTPETLQLMLAQKGYDHYFRNLKAVVIDEWHELVGSKRGVQCELALSRLKTVCQDLRVWGISATIGNMEESLQVLLGSSYDKVPHAIVKGDIKKVYKVASLLPDELEELPWAGHLGIKLIEKIMPILNSSGSTLIFLNTRGQAEIWYQKLLDHAPELAGIIALHHGSMSRETRHWVEDALYNGQLKAVICTSSLDLGVDFRPVETIIQVGGPKGVARFMQRAGRSGHQPGATSKIYFVPTHSLELIEAAALRAAIDQNMLESRIPFVRSFDVLIQYLVTLAVSNGFDQRQIFEEVRETFCYSSISESEWHWCLRFITQGGDSLTNYDEFHKVIIEEGLYKVTSKRVALRHRLSIGTIVSDTMLKVRFLGGGYLGNIEEYFLSRLSPGDNFWFAGRNLELVRIKDMTAQVRKSNKKTGPTPSWQGGRMPLSSQMSKMIRYKLNEAISGTSTDPEVEFLMPLIKRQASSSLVPREDQFLIECFESRDGYHVLCYPFEGRFVHEGMGALLAYRIALLQPITFSIAMNDYGFELLSDQPIPIQEALDTDIFSTAHLVDDILASVNSMEMARRRFRDIATISGLVFQGYPGSQKKDRHLQASSQLFFDVFNDYDKENLLLRQAFDESMDFQLEEARLREALQRISQQEIIVKHPGRYTPFSFPIIVDRMMREKISSEKLEDRIKRMKVEID